MSAKKYSKSIFIFRRDLRLHDNIGLYHALKNSQIVIPIFIFTPEQLENNKYKSDNCIQFMIESLEELNESLNAKKSRLFYFYGHPSEIIDDLLHKNSIQAVYLNMDYTPYSLKRDEEIKKVCQKNNVSFLSYEDILLYPIKSITNQQNKVYTKFTPYFQVAKKQKVSPMMYYRLDNFLHARNKFPHEFKRNIHQFYKKRNEHLAVNGGRSYALKILNSLQKFKNYNLQRNNLTYETTRLSPFIKFGCVSIREVYFQLKKVLGIKNDLIKQLYWREFYYNIAYEYDYVFSKKGNLKDKYNKIEWNYNRSHINKWMSGNTGFPIVDACMREMNNTGFMHNRGRLIVSSFLVKILLIDWKVGELYFAQTLLDYDPSVNNGNWQWSAGSGADAQPYFRIFNPWLQSAHYDPEAQYIKKWIPELEHVPPKHIHEWHQYYQEYKNNAYHFEPMVNYDKQKAITLNAYKKIYK
jgi:deoxyribodipyrimidine photo-lyase